jgi:hypothetical protein
VKVKLEYFDFILYDPAIHDKKNFKVRTSHRLKKRNSLNLNKIISGENYLENFKLNKNKKSFDKSER